MSCVPCPQFVPVKEWNTVFPAKRLTLEKKSPYNRNDISPRSGYSTYQKTFPGALPRGAAHHRVAHRGALPMCASPRSVPKGK